jgi:hypothetical protein
MRKRRLWVILGALVIALIILLVICAAVAVLFGLTAGGRPSMAVAIWSVSFILPFAGIVLLLVVVFRAKASRAVRQKIRAAQDWPSTKGLVLVSEVRDEGGESGWRAQVVYRYEVGGRVYENSRIAVAVEYGRQGFQAHRRLAARFPLGAQVVVYYNPQNPADAALVKGDPNSSSPSSF